MFCGLMIFQSGGVWKNSYYHVVYNMSFFVSRILFWMLIPGYFSYLLDIPGGNMNSNFIVAEVSNFQYLYVYKRINRAAVENEDQ